MDHGLQPGDQVGPYKLLQLIGEGGFGSVFMAEQSSPVHRRVAVKVIKVGMDTRQVVARFEAERQALAMMDHPNIARVLDAGATAQGRPYFVMELVKGLPITRYADKERLTVPQRLALFEQVCNAVQHAHTKGVMHRDIKPSNVLVSTHDGEPFAKVIDFGIAKATDHRLTERTLFTDFRAMVGTPEYMSPEQAEGSLDIDTRTDVYSLGVLLYELLCGATPFDGRRLRSAAYAELARIICEVEPPRPSARVSQDSPQDEVPKEDTGRERLGQDRSEGLGRSPAHDRGTDPRSLYRVLRGDLDRITMKALEKDRRRRYESPSAIAADIRRHASGEPVLAVAPTWRYRASKFIRKHRVGVAVAAAVGTSLILGAGVATWGWFEAARALEEVHQAAREKAELDVYQQEFGRGWVLYNNGKHDEAIPVLRNALSGLEKLIGPGSREYQGRAAHFGEMVFGCGYQAEGMEVYRRVLAQRRQFFGDGDPWTVGFFIQISHSAGTAEGWDVQRAYLEQGVEIARAQMPMGDETRSHIIGTLAWWYRYHGVPSAISVYREFLDNLLAEKPQRLEEIQTARDAIDALNSAVPMPPTEAPPAFRSSDSDENGN